MGGGETNYYEAYDYDHLSDALADWNITLNVGYIEENYPRLAGEYGCDFYYADDSKKDCQQSRFFSGFCDANESVFSVILTVFLAWLFIEGLRHLNFWEILFPIAFFCIIYAKPLGITAFTPWPVLGAALLGSIGLSMIFKPKKHRTWTVGNGQSNSFGEVSLYVPRAWNVDVNVDKAFGGINMRGRMEGTSTHRLVVTGETNFGALTIVFI